MTKKLFHTILSLLLVFSICAPVNVFAAEVTDEKSTVESIDSEDATILSTNANGFSYPGDSTLNLTLSKTKITYTGVALSDGVVILKLTKTDGSDFTSFTFACDGAQHTITRNSNPIPKGTYNISLVMATTSYYTLFVSFS